MRSVIGGIVGFFFGFMIWFPYGIFYAVQSSDSQLLEVVSVLKGLIGL